MILERDVLNKICSCKELCERSGSWGWCPYISGSDISCRIIYERDVMKKTKTKLAITSLEKPRAYSDGSYYHISIKEIGYEDDKPVFFTDDIGIHESFAVEIANEEELPLIINKFKNDIKYTR